MSFRSIRTTKPYLAGKRYVEFTIDAKPSGGLYVGVDQGANNYVSPRETGPGENTLYPNSASYKSSGQINSRTTALTLPSAGIPAEVLVTGDVVSMLVNLDDGFIEFWRNGVTQQTIAYPPGASTYVLVSLGAKGQQITANLSQNVAFVHTAPATYTDWAGNAI